MDFLPTRKFNAVKTIKARKEGVWVVLDMFVIVLEGLEEELVLGVVNGFNDKSVVAREVEKGTGFAWRPEFGEDIFCCEGKKIICGIDPEKFLAESTKNPWSIILEFEIIFSGRCQLVSNTVSINEPT